MARAGTVYVRNLRETMKQLKEFDPDASKGITKKITKAAGTVRDSARKMIPAGGALTNWGRYIEAGRNRDLSYRSPQPNIKTKRGGSSRKRGGVYSNYIGVINSSPSGALFELAGRANPSSRLVKGLERSGHGVSRRQGTQRPGVFKAFEQNEGQARKEIETALDEAQRIVQAKLNAMI